MFVVVDVVHAEKRVILACCHYPSARQHVVCPSARFGNDVFTGTSSEHGDVTCFGKTDRHILPFSSCRFLAVVVSRHCAFSSFSNYLLVDRSLNKSKRNVNLLVDNSMTQNNINNDDHEVTMNEDDPSSPPPTMQSNFHAFHRHMPFHFLAPDTDGVPLVTEFAHRKARQIIQLVHSIQLKDSMFQEESAEGLTGEGGKDKVNVNAGEEEEQDNDQDDNNDIDDEEHETLVRRKQEERMRLERE
jgi:hypothetical protein